MYMEILNNGNNCTFYLVDIRSLSNHSNWFVFGFIERERMNLEQELKLLSSVCDDIDCVNTQGCPYIAKRDDIRTRHNLSLPQFYARLNYYGITNGEYVDVCKLPMFLKKQAC